MREEHEKRIEDARLAQQARHERLRAALDAEEPVAS
jgi:hypothetical protein